MSNDKKYKAWSFTLRPALGAQSALQEAVVGWLKKQPYGFACLEMPEDDTARHIHGCVWKHKEPCRKGEINTALQRICERSVPDWSPAQQLVLRRGTRIMYNDDWIENYLSKDEDTIVLYNVPPEDTSEFYPSEDEQKAVINKSAAVDKKFHDWSVQFFEWYENSNISKTNDISKYVISLFMSDMMYVSKKWNVITDGKKRRDVCTSLFYYVSGYKGASGNLSELEFNKFIDLMKTI